MLNKKTDNKIYVYQGIDACGKFRELEGSIGVTLASWANSTDNTTDNKIYVYQDALSCIMHSGKCGGP